MSKKINNIINDEFDLLKIGTKHNTDRARLIMSNMLENPGKSIYSQSSSRSEAKAAYQFFNNANLDIDEIGRVHRTRTIERIVETEQPILVIQDTTYVDYTSQAKKKDNNKIHKNMRGIKLHSSIVTTHDGLNLGVLSQLSYNFDPYIEELLTKDQKKTRPIEDKESYRWIESFNESMHLLPEDIDVTVISDREGDIYEYFHAVISKRRYFLTRIAQNRMIKDDDEITTEDNKKLFDSIRSTDCMGEICTKVPRNSHKNIDSREAKLEVRYNKYEIKRPVIQRNNRALPESLTVYVIHVIEKNPPSGVEPLEWFLMTNRPIITFEEAVQQVKNYLQRWKIERFHYTLKSGGCNIEDIQARSMEVTTSIIMIYSIVSVFIMNMTYAARLTPDAPCSLFFDDDEWKLLYSMVYKTTEIPEKPITIKEAVKLIAWLGSGQRPPSDGDPGVKLIWRGLEKLYCLCEYKDFIHEYVGVKN